VSLRYERPLSRWAWLVVQIVVWVVVLVAVRRRRRPIAEPAAIVPIELVESEDVR
jgi:uncharacterized membrane protein YhfC